VQKTLIKGAEHDCLLKGRHGSGAGGNRYFSRAKQREALMQRCRELGIAATSVAMPADGTDQKLL